MDIWLVRVYIEEADYVAYPSPKGVIMNSWACADYSCMYCVYTPVVYVPAVSSCKLMSWRQDSVHNCVPYVHGFFLLPRSFFVHALLSSSLTSTNLYFFTQSPSHSRNTAMSRNSTAILGEFVLFYTFLLVQSPIW